MRMGSFEAYLFALGGSWTFYSGAGTAGLLLLTSGKSPPSAFVCLSFIVVGSLLAGLILWLGTRLSRGHRRRTR